MNAEDYPITAQDVVRLEPAGEGVLGRCAGDEPVFILCGRDPNAAHVVRVWALCTEQDATEPPERIARAREVADAIEAWRAAHRLEGGTDAA